MQAVAAGCLRGVVGGARVGRWSTWPPRRLAVARGSRFHSDPTTPPKPISEGRCCASRRAPGVSFLRATLSSTAAAAADGDPSAVPPGERVCLLDMSEREMQQWVESLGTVRAHDRHQAGVSGAPGAVRATTRAGRGTGACRGGRHPEDHLRAAATERHHRVLLHGQDGPVGALDHRGDCGSGAASARAVRAPRRGPGHAPRQRGVHGHGRAATQRGQRVARRGHSVARQGAALVAQQSDREHCGVGAGDAALPARVAGPFGGQSERHHRRGAQLDHAHQPQVPHRAADGDVARRVNDTLQDAQRLLQLTAHVPCKINLIPFNAHVGTEFRPSPLERVEAFRAHLHRRGATVTVRRQRGDDKMAACGQLGCPGERSTPPRMRVPSAFRHAVHANAPRTGGRVVGA
eukprot:ctg_1091.g344